MGNAKKKSGAAATVLTIIVAIVLVVLQQKQHITNNAQSPPSGGSGASAPAGAPTAGSATGARAVIQAYEAEQSDVLVEFDAVVTKLLSDDKEGDAHQRFIVRLPAEAGFDRTLLISHNIDLAPRVPVREGDSVRIRGEYEWSQQGGVIHWTHHNPNRNPRHPGGWIEHNGNRYE